MNPIIKSFIAATILTHRALVKYTGVDLQVALATAATDVIAGVVDSPGGAAIGQRVDVIVWGSAEVIAGGALAAGGFITADATGRAVAPAPAAGVNNRTAGLVHTSGVAGDFVKAFINPGQVQG